VQERLQKILSRAGVASRRGAEQVMSEGRVMVNGVTVRELGSKADITTDDVRVDGVRIRVPDRPVYLVLNKPKGIVTTRHDPEGRATVMGLVPPVAGLFPVGRLDVTTEGLLILTNDGAFAERVSHPRYEVPRVYEAKVHRVPDAEAIARLRRGVRVEGDLLVADGVRVLEAGNNAWLEVTLHQGKKHEVKRLLEAVGHPVSKLRRVAFGPVTIKGLEPGQFRELTPREVKGLLEARPAPRAEGLSRPAIPRRHRPAPAKPPAAKGERPVPEAVQPGAKGHRPPPGASRPAGKGGRPRRPEAGGRRDRPWTRGDESSTRGARPRPPHDHSGPRRPPARPRRPPARPRRAARR
jgi:pseudouridine synthase